MARSGSFSEQFAGKFGEGLGYFLTIDWSQSDPLSQEAIRTNTTTLTATLYIGRKGSGYYISSSAKKQCYINVGGESKSSSSVTIGYSQPSSRIQLRAKALLSKTFTIQHEEDGSATTTIRGGVQVGFKLGGTNVSWAYTPNRSNEYGAQPITLDPIPRPSTSSISQATPMEIGNRVTINTTRNLSSLTHVLYYSFDEKNWYNINSEDEKFSTSYEWELTEDLAKNFINTSSSLIYIRTDTYHNGSTKLGSTQFSTSLYLTEQVGRPKLNSWSISQKNDGNLDYFILDKSQVSASIKAETYGDAYIKYFVYSINDSVFYNILPLEDSLNEGLYSFILKNNIGSIASDLFLKISIYAIDSRGFISQTFSSPQIPILSYTNPSIRNIKMMRGNIINYEFEENPNGDRIKINFFYKIIPLTITNEDGEEIHLNQKNILFRYSIDDGEISTPVTHELEDFSSDLEEGYSYIPDLILNKDSQYKFYLTIQDALSSSTEILRAKSRGVLLNFGSNGYSAAIGGKANDNKFTIFYPTVFKEGIEYNELITGNTEANNDLNDLLPGWYSFINTPADTLDKFYHYPLTPEQVNQLGLIDKGTIEVAAISTSNANWMTQKLTYLSTEGEIICFSRAFTGNWSEWQIDGSNAEKEIDYSQITAVGSENGSIMITNETGSFDLTKMDDYLDNYIEDTSNVEIEARFKRYLDGVFKSYILDIVYPVGSIYISANSTSPAVLFGGKWRQIQDKFLLAGYTTYLPTTTGGSATASIKAHKHGANVGANRDLSKIVVYNQNGLYDGEAAAGFSLSVSATKGTSKVSTDKLMFTTEAGSATINTIPPYYSVYVWQREED